MLYSFFMPKAKLDERMDVEYASPAHLSSFLSWVYVRLVEVMTYFSPTHACRIARLVETVTKKPLSENKKYLTLEVVCSRLSDGEDVDVPPIRYQFRDL
jgi:hypothetical protein